MTILKILDNFLILSLIAGSFFIGIWLADRFHIRAQIEKKDALERQYMRIRAGVDADDPSKPYVPAHSATSFTAPVVAPTNNGFSNPIPPSFMEELHKKGKAAIKINKPGVTP